MWELVIQFAITALGAIPSLVRGVESLWSHTPKSGASKWISVEQALSGSIQLVADQVAKQAPPGTKTEEISAAVVVFSKAVNDAFVALANALHLLPTTAK